MRGAESVEKVHERNPRFNGDQVGDAGQIHHFLHAARSQHGKAGLTGGHYVLVVAENGQGLRCERPRRYVEYAGKQLPGYFVHVRNHQQQPLRSGERSGQSTSLERTVHCAGGSCLGLHLNDFDCLPKNVFTSACRPFVDIFCHRGRRSDRIDRRYLAEHISDVGGCVVSVTGDKFFLCHF